MRERLRRYLVARAAVARAARGMTLLEIMVVIAIIAIVGTSVGFGVMGFKKKADVKTTGLAVNKMSSVIQNMMLDSNECPHSLAELAEGASAPLRQKDMKDVWGQEWVYNCPGQKPGRDFDICSKGPDKREGTEDDICND